MEISPVGEGLRHGAVDGRPQHRMRETNRAGPFWDSPKPSFWPNAFVHECMRRHDVSGSFGLSAVTVHAYEVSITAY